jgi:DnaK suppressor protein
MTLREVDVTPAKKTESSSARRSSTKALPQKRASATKKAVAAKPAAKKATPAKKAAGSSASRAKAVPAAKKTTRTKPPAKAPASSKTAKAASASKQAKPSAVKGAKATSAGKQAKQVAQAKSAPATKAARQKTSAAASKKEAPKRSTGSGKATTGEAAAKRAPSTLKAAGTDAVAKKPTVGPYAKDAGFFDEQRTLLLSERAIYSGQAVDLRAEADSLALEREPGDVQFDEESGEGGTVTVDRERNLALSAQASAAVEEIDDALRKIDRKSYGGCERCHQAIPKARLRALPFARLCVACKSGGLSRR